MNYLKFYNGGNVIRRLAPGGRLGMSEFSLMSTEEKKAYLKGLGLDYDELSEEFNSGNTSASSLDDHLLNSANYEVTYAGQNAADYAAYGGDKGTSFDVAAAVNERNNSNTSTYTDASLTSTGVNVGQINTVLKDTIKEMDSIAKAKDIASKLGVDSKYIGTGKGQMNAKGAAAVGVLSQYGTQALNMLDEGLMGDKNFGAQSQAIDTAVHGTSKALISSGNPYAMAAGVALEGANFLTKAGGQTVQGFDVDIKSSGYGNLGHKESSSSRDFGAMIGLGGLNAAATQRKLKQRNEEAQMAMKAANIADTTKFEQEARMNSVDDVIQQNEIALQGGIDTSLLAAKLGAKLVQKETIHYYEPEKITYYTSEIVSAKNGAKLEEIEVSEDPNVIPEGALHKNKNHLDLDNITAKGIPVLTVDDPEAETFEDIKASEDSIQQHAEIEDSEIIFNKELTLFVENMRKLWHESDKKDDSICVEAGMRLAKEIIENTEDNTDVTQKAIEAVENENN